MLLSDDYCYTAGIRQDDYTILNASVSWESSDEHWLATLGASNLTDEVVIVSGFSSQGTGITTVSPSRPREWFLKLKYSY